MGLLFAKTRERRGINRKKNRDADKKCLHPYFYFPIRQMTIRTNIANNTNPT